MPTYRFEAMDVSGDEVKDLVSAATEQEAQQKICRMGYFVTRLSTSKSSAPAPAALAHMRIGQLNELKEYFVVANRYMIDHPVLGYPPFGAEIIKALPAGLRGGVLVLPVDASLMPQGDDHPILACLDVIRDRCLNWFGGSKSIRQRFEARFGEFLEVLYNRGTSTGRYFRGNARISGRVFGKQSPAFEVRFVNSSLLEKLANLLSECEREPVLVHDQNKDEVYSVDPESGRVYCE